MQLWLEFSHLKIEGIQRTFTLIWKHVGDVERSKCKEVLYKKYISLDSKYRTTHIFFYRVSIW